MSQNSKVIRIYLYIVKFLLLLFFIPCLSWSHPVTFKNGQEIQINNFSTFKKFNYTYSFSNKHSLGASLMEMNNKNHYLLEGNYLFKRYNEIGSQANFYGGILAGINEKNRFISGAYLEADWESRRFYISSKASLIDNQYMTKNRLGFAPYLADYDDLHTWVMVEHVYIEDGEISEINPLLRFFYDQYLWEVGMGLKGNFLFNFMIHF